MKKAAWIPSASGRRLEIIDRFQYLSYIYGIFDLLCDLRYGTICKRRFVHCILLCIQGAGI